MTRVVSKRVCVRLDDAMRLFCFPNWGNCHYQWFWRRPRRGSAEKSRGKRKKQLEIAVEKLESTSVRIGASQRVAPTRAVMKRPPVRKRGRKEKKDKKGGVEKMRQEELKRWRDRTYKNMEGRRTKRQKIQHLGSSNTRHHTTHHSWVFDPLSNKTKPAVERSVPRGKQGGEGWGGSPAQWLGRDIQVLTARSYPGNSVLYAAIWTTLPSRCSILISFPRTRKRRDGRWTDLAIQQPTEMRALFAGLAVA